MKRFVLLALFVLISVIVKAQTSGTSSIIKKDTTIFIVDSVDIESEYPGGFLKFLDYIHHNSKLVNGKGTVVISFIVEKDGSLSGITISKGVSKDIDKEALRLMANSPKWEPSLKHDKPVRSKIFIPIKFGSN